MQTQSNRVIKIESNKPGTIAEICQTHHGEQILIWTQFDEEGDILAVLLPGSVHLTGKMKQEKRLQVLEDFRRGIVSILIVKPRLMGSGLNLQFCSVCIFSWSADSWEAFYQAVGRIHRYGQKKRVKIYIPYTDLEKPMLQNVMRKKSDYLEDATFQEQLYIESLMDDLKELAEIDLSENDAPREFLSPIYGDDYNLIHGDCIEVMAGMPDDQFDLAVFSPPFADLYSYSDNDEDLGNCNSLDDEFEMHFSFFAHHLYRVMKSGCVVAMHIAPLAILKQVKGYTGIRDFPAECRAIFESVGFIYDGKATIGKNPQAQSIRTHAQGLAFKTLHSNSRKMRFAIPDYLMKFMKPGDAPPFANTDVTNEDWIKMAHPIWDFIDETKTLNSQTKQLSEGDIKHICPLQLDVIDACVRLWSDRGERVLSPFLGIGSEGVVSVRYGRKFTGIELKAEYFKMAGVNIDYEQRVRGRQLHLFEHRATAA